MPDYYFELKHQVEAAQEAALSVIEQVSGEFALLSGRRYELVDAYRLDDADRVLVCLGSTAGTAKDVVDELRAEGEAVGLLQIHSFRPFPVATVREALDHDPTVVCVLDRAESPGGAAPLYAELAAALYGVGPELESYVYGLGGRDLHAADLREILAGNAAHYVGLRSS